MTSRCLKGLSRRDLLKYGALAASAPAFIPASALGRAGRPAPSDRVTLGIIGCGGMGGIDASNFLPLPDVEIVALCDVDTGHVETLRDLLTRWMVNKGRKTDISMYGDFREVIARPDVDAVVVATPDHWHAIIAVEALRAGKDVYGEKPMGRTIYEQQQMVQAVRQYGRVFQTGTQSRSDARVRHAVELVRNGRIGEIKKVIVGVPGGIATGPQPIMAVPEGFDYDMWLGPAPFKPYTEKRCHSSFRSILDYSGGGVTDLGTHYLDITRWGCRHDHAQPVAVSGHGIYPTNGLFDAALGVQFDITFDDGIVYECSNRFALGPRWEGTEGWIHIPMGFPLPTAPITASDPAILKSVIGPDEERVYKSDHHWANFIECVKTRREPIMPVEQGHLSTMLAHLGNITMELDRPLEWDGERERFVGDADANAKLRRAMRTPWTL